MASAKNMVLAGDYAGCRIFRMSATFAYISGTMKRIDDVPITPKTVVKYELLTENIIRSGNSLLLTGSLDPACLTSIRFHASAEQQEKGIYTLALKFYDDKRSLIEVDEKIFNTIERRMQSGE